jgi:hypothetical protein
VLSTNDGFQPDLQVLRIKVIHTLTADGFFKKLINKSVLAEH